MLHPGRPKVIHPKPLAAGVGDVSWWDSDNLLIDATYKSELSEGQGGQFMLNLKTKHPPVWNGEVPPTMADPGTRSETDRR
jgi:hypothetical protein